MKTQTYFAPLRRTLRLCVKYFSAPRALNDYATHVPILIGLARLREIRSVLEFGCGHYSTPTFLNRLAFPQLERLISIENDRDWAARIHEAAKDDERWTLKVINGEIADCVPYLELEPFDLILIDDSKTSSQRAATIRAVAARQLAYPWVVIHDFEIEEYRRAALGFREQRRFKAFNPETGLLSKTTTNARTLQRTLKKKARALQPDDIAGWSAALL